MAVNRIFLNQTWLPQSAAEWQCQHRILYKLHNRSIAVQRLNLKVDWCICMPKQRQPDSWHFFLVYKISPLKFTMYTINHIYFSHMSQISSSSIVGKLRIFVKFHGVHRMEKFTISLHTVKCNKVNHLSQQNFLFLHWFTVIYNIFKLTWPSLGNTM